MKQCEAEHMQEMDHKVKEGKPVSAWKRHANDFFHD